MKAFLRWLIRAYQLLLSPLLGPRCRFYPSCSSYALEALQVHALPQALWLISRRLARCQPWGGSGYDPVPPKSGSGNDSDHDSDHASLRQKYPDSLVIGLHEPHTSECRACAARMRKLVLAAQIRHRKLRFTPYTSPLPRISLLLTCGYGLRDYTIS